MMKKDQRPEWADIPNCSALLILSNYSNGVWQRFWCFRVHVVLHRAFPRGVTLLGFHLRAYLSRQPSLMITVCEIMLHFTGGVHWDMDTHRPAATSPLWGREFPCIRNHCLKFLHPRKKLCRGFVQNPNQKAASWNVFIYSLFVEVTFTTPAKRKLHPSN